MIVLLGRRRRSQQNVDELKTALMNATKLMDRLQNLLKVPSFPDLMPDECVCNMILNLWVKRCWFLAEHGGWFY